MSEIVVIFISREEQKSKYDWANIIFNNSHVGKARCLKDVNELTICSINIYPEYQRHGYGKIFVEDAKHKYNKIVADRVRYEAIGFWEKMGFVRYGETTDWIYNMITTLPKIR